MFRVATSFLLSSCQFVYSRLAWLIFAIALITTSYANTQQLNDVLLEDGQPVNREFSGGQKHTYKVDVEAGQYIHVIADQRGMDVVARLFGPDGKLITAVDNPNGSNGAEPVHIVAHSAGIYRIEIESFDKTAPPGRYEVKIIVRRPIAQADRDRLAARKAFDQAETLVAKGERASLEAAITKYQESLILYRSIGDSSEEYTSLLGLGICYWTQKEYEKAVEQFEKSLQVARKLNDKYRQGRSLDRASYAYREFADIDNSIRSGVAALGFFQTADGSLTDQAQLAQHLGLMHNLVGEFERAREYFHQARILYQKAGSHEHESSLLTWIGYSYEVEENYAKALEYRKKALVVARDQKQQARVNGLLASLASNYISAGDTKLAKDTIALLEPDLNTETGANLWANVGLAYYKLGEYDKALPLLNKSLERSRQSNSASSKRNEAISLRHIAAVFRDQGRLSEAVANMEKSINILEFLRDHSGSPEMKVSFVASLFHYYEFYVDLKMRLDAVDPSSGYATAALEFAEKVKVRGLIDLLTKARVDTKQGVDPGLLELETKINNELTDRLDEMAKLERSKPTPEQKIAASQRVDRAQDTLREIQLKIRNTTPHYAGLTQPQALTVADIQQQILDKDTILIEYQLGDDNSYMWSVAHEKIKGYRLPKRSVIEALSKRVYELMTARQNRLSASATNTNDALLRTESQKLSNMLLGPAAADLGTKRLVIVADGVLHYLPFSALPVPTTDDRAEKAYKPMLLDHEIVSLPSASVLSVLRKEFGDRKPAPLTAAVLADPVYAADDARVRPSAGNKATDSVRGKNAAGPFSRLLFSREEANAILSVAPPRSSIAAMDFDATRKFAMSDELEKYRIVHFSTHGSLDSRRPELSGLALSQVTKGGEPVEGSLRLHEIYNMRLGADLVVLSGCQTGLGKDIRGEGLIGLTRGFMYAGAPRVVASLWQVDDGATTELMRRFYTSMLRRGMTPAAALREAQIEMFKKPLWRSPYYWGAFVLQGEWR